MCILVYSLYALQNLSTTIQFYQLTVQVGTENCAASLHSHKVTSRTNKDVNKNKQQQQQPVNQLAVSGHYLCLYILIRVLQFHRNFTAHSTMLCYVPTKLYGSR